MRVYGCAAACCEEQGWWAVGGSMRIAKDVCGLQVH